MKPSLLPILPTRTNHWLLDRLGRVTSSGRLIPEIDGLRFVAIMSVLFFHLGEGFFPKYPNAWQSPSGVVDQVMRSGWFGVQLFFIISGFILSMPFAEQHVLGERPVNLKKYFIRRLTRLEPPYIIALLLLAGLQWANGRSLGEMLPHLGASLIYMHNIIYGSMNGMVDWVTWSLEVEVQFYILAPLLAYVFAIRKTPLRRAVLAGAIVLCIVQSECWPGLFVQDTFFRHARFFLMGFVLSELWVTRWKRKPEHCRQWDVLGVAGWAGVFVLLWAPPELRYVWGVPWVAAALTAACLAAYIGAFRGRLLSRLFSVRWIVVIGGMCYTIYLYHGPLAWWARQPVAFGIEPGGNSALDLMRVTVLPALLLVGVGAFLFIAFEKPFMYRDWPAKLAARLGLRAPAPRPVAPVAVESPEAADMQEVGQGK